MDFSSCFVLSPGLFCFSPDATMLAYASGSALVIRDAETLVVRCSRSALGSISSIEFSPDSLYILASSEESLTIQVWRADGSDVAQHDEKTAHAHMFKTNADNMMHDGEHFVKDYDARKRTAVSRSALMRNAAAKSVDAGALATASSAAAVIPCRYFGVVKASWHASQRVVVSWSDFGLYVNFWDLMSGKMWVIKSLKHATSGCAFSGSDWRFCAVLTRHENRDAVKIYDTLQKELVQCFQIDTIAAANLAWSPDERYIAVWDGPFCYKMLVYRRDGKRVANYVAYEHALGIVSVAWSPSSQFLAIGSCDHKIRLLNNITFKPIVEWSHTTTLSVSAPRDAKQSKSVTVFMEHGMLLKSNSTMSLSSLNDHGVSHSGYQKLCPPFNVTLPTIASNASNPAKTDGYSSLLWSPDGMLLAARCDLTPSVVSIFSVLGLSRQVVLCHSQPIRHMEWHPRAKGTLVLCTGTQQLYFWHARPYTDELDVAFSDSDNDNDVNNYDMDIENSGFNDAASGRRQSALDSRRLEIENEREMPIGEYAGNALALTVPENGFSVQSFRWSCDGTRIAVFSKRSFCVGFERRPPAAAHLLAARAAIAAGTDSDADGGHPDSYNNNDNDIGVDYGDSGRGIGPRW